LTSETTTNNFYKYYVLNVNTLAHMLGIRIVELIPALSLFWNHSPSISISCVLEC